MGIQNLKALIGAVGRQRRLCEYSGQRFAVDISIWLYRWVYSDTPVLCRLASQLMHFKRYNITPLYVFDGKSDATLKVEAARRTERREQTSARMVELAATLQEKLLETGMFEVVDEASGNAAPSGNACVAEVTFPQFLPTDEGGAQAPATQALQEAVALQDQLANLERRQRRPTRHIVRQCQELLTELRVPWIHAPGEADVTIARLSRDRHVDGVISEDTDMLPFGCDLFLTKFDVRSHVVTEFRLSDVLEHLAMPRHMFVDLCILCGCDYADKIYMIGAKTALKLLKIHNSIEEILEYIAKDPKRRQRHTYPEHFIRQVHTARAMFLTTAPPGSPELSLTVEVPEIMEWARGSEANVANVERMLQEVGMRAGEYAALIRDRDAAAPTGKQLTLDKFFGARAE